jgi:hypothetical protein
MGEQSSKQGAWSSEMHGQNLKLEDGGVGYTLGVGVSGSE